MQKISITIIVVNVHHYRYSILKREIKRWLNTNQKHSNINKELILSYKATRRGLSLKMSMILAMFSFFVKSLLEDSKQSLVGLSYSVSLFRRYDLTLFIVEKLLSASAEDTGKLLFQMKKFHKVRMMIRINDD